MNSLSAVKEQLESFEKQLVWDETRGDYVSRLRIRFSLPIPRPLLTKLVEWVGGCSSYLVEHVRWHHGNEDLRVSEVVFVTHSRFL